MSLSYKQITDNFPETISITVKQNNKKKLIIIIIIFDRENECFNNFISLIFSTFFVPAVCAERVCDALHNIYIQKKTVSSHHQNIC